MSSGLSSTIQQISAILFSANASAILLGTVLLALPGILLDSVLLVVDGLVVNRLVVNRVILTPAGQT